MFYRNVSLILVLLFVCCLFLAPVNANEPATYYKIGHLSYAASVLNSKEIELIKEWKELDKLEIQQAILGVQWDDNKEDMVKNAISFGNAVTVDVLGGLRLSSHPLPIH